MTKYPNLFDITYEYIPDNIYPNIVTLSIKYSQLFAINGTELGEYAPLYILLFKHRVNVLTY